VLAVGDVQPSPGEIRTCGVDVATTSCSPCIEPGSLSPSPVPMAIEHADPGGVSWTKRSSSLTWWSWSALNPAFST